MGVTPSDFNFLNQQHKYPAEITLDEGSVGEESLECQTIEREDKKGAEKRRQRKERKPT